MSQENAIHITSSCIIRKSRVLKNEQVIFESKKRGTDFLQEAYERLAVNYPKFFKMDNLCKLGMAAAHVLLSELDTKKYHPDATGIVLSNKDASIEADINYYTSSLSYPSPSLFVYTLPNIVIGEMSIRYGFKGENAFFISEKFDGDWLYFYVHDLIQNNRLQSCICGWVDVVNDQFDACFFLVEAGKNNGINFTAENLNRYYKQ